MCASFVPLSCVFQYKKSTHLGFAEATIVEFYSSNRRHRRIWPYISPPQHPLPLYKRLPRGAPVWSPSISRCFLGTRSTLVGITNAAHSAEFNRRSRSLLSSLRILVYYILPIIHSFLLYLLLVYEKINYGVLFVNWINEPLHPVRGILLPTDIP